MQRLSLGLTRDRKLIGARYLDDDRLLGAYLLFYWPVSYLQARGVLSELPRRPRSALDLGSGPGPVAFAALDAGAAEVVAADRSARALAAARRARHRGRASRIATREWDPQRRGALSGLAGSRRFDLVTLGHVVNELFQGEGAATRRAALIEEALGLLAPGGSLVVIEPALRETSRALLEVRDLLVARGVAVRAPCLFRGACPALSRPTDWCHAERPVDPPPLVEEIGRRAGLRKEAVKMSYLVLAPQGGGVERAAARAHLPHRLRAAAVEGAAALHGLRAGGTQGARAAGEGRDAEEPRVRGAPARGRGRGQRRRAARGRAQAVAGIGRPGDRGGRAAGSVRIPCGRVRR